MYTRCTCIQENQVWKLAFVANWLFFSPRSCRFCLLPLCCDTSEKGKSFLRVEQVHAVVRIFKWGTPVETEMRGRIQLRLFAASVDSLVRPKCKNVTKNITMKHWTASASTTAKNIQKRPPRTGEPQLAERWRAYRLLTGNSVLEVELVSFQSTQLLTRRWKPREATILSEAWLTV